MIRCDVVIVGGGPAGSSCAWRLRRSGADVVVIDAADFPRDKVCAGWITPQVIADLQFDVEAYRCDRTFQPVTGFRVGLIGSSHAVTTRYDHPVSYGIRRCEFDDYLLKRSGVSLMTACPVKSIRRERGGWVVNERLTARMLVGAGGQFCPVAQLLNPGDQSHSAGAPIVRAQEVEYPIVPESDEEIGAAGPDAELPELYFSRDLNGYGWCIRKQRHLNVGLGRVDPQSLPQAVAEFVAFLTKSGRLKQPPPARWRGHAYLLHDERHRRVVDDGVMLIGDAAGLAYPESGEGIRPAIESGLLAASTILDAGNVFSRERLDPYAERVFEGSARGAVARGASRISVSQPGRAIGRWLLGKPPFVRHVVLDRWFLHAA